MPLAVRSVESFAEAARLLAAEEGARLLAGGTLLMRAVNEGDVRITVLVRCTDPGRELVRREGERVRIGAGVTLSRLARAPETAFLAPVVRAVGGPAIRNMATVGGNLFAHSPYGDLGTAFLALDARVTLAEGGTGRELPLEDFYRRRDHRPPPVVTAVSVLRPRDPAAFRFRKFSRVRPKGASVVAVAAHLPAFGGRLEGVRIALGAMGPTPLRARAAEAALEGRPLGTETAGAAAAAVLDGLRPSSDAIASEWYRRELAPVVLRRLLLAEEPRR